ncbi:glutathione S-transferase family protein [Pseudomonas sp. RIT-PI-S]|uniref:glutathione S-transferase family protein n=1 Tax=Pseudomonas sp. RIT-PI-S TaxID=3035295 RepID=UPI0021DA18E7|nr:glutathione S-transferase family protein [Pseudomonas sp. RIT-PI-S]
MLKVLGRTSSINVRKVLWACTELQLPTTREEDWGAGFRSPTAPEFLALNPNAQIPVLIDKDFVLWESNSIVRYLANAYGGERLYPQAARERARVDQWLDWQASELNPSWGYVFHSLVRKNPAYQDATALREGQQRWCAAMAILEQQLQRTGGFVSGEQFSLADIVIGLSVNRWFGTPFERPDLPAVNAYYARLAERESFFLFCGAQQP